MMGRRRHSRLFATAVSLLAVGAACLATADGDTRVERPSSDSGLRLPLPPLATVASGDASGATWMQTGLISGTVISAEREFALALRAAGWKLDKTIALGRAPGGSKLALWTRRGRRVLLMLWETEIGTCGFAWGDERASGDS